MKWTLLILCFTLPLFAGDDRDNFESTAYIGLSVDTFAAPSFNTVVYNKNAETGKKERAIGGFDFQYRVLGGNVGTGTAAKERQLWVYGETLHGVRSSEVNCTGDAATRPVVCGVFGDPFSTANAGKQLVYLLRNASSLEAYMGLRYEFLTLNPLGTTSNTAKLYVKAQAGFMSVADNGGDVLDNHHVGLGAVIVDGNYSGSYLEAGFGRNDVFLENRRKRLKVDGYLTFGTDKMKDSGFRPFVQMTVDSDMGRGADSIQTFLGLNIDLGKLFD